MYNGSENQSDGICGSRACISKDGGGEKVSEIMETRTKERSEIMDTKTIEVSEMDARTKERSEIMDARTKREVKRMTEQRRKH